MFVAVIDERSCDVVNHMHFVQSYTLGLSSVFAQGQNASVATTEIFRGLNRYSLQDEMGDESRERGQGREPGFTKIRGCEIVYGFYYNSFKEK